MNPSVIPPVAAGIVAFALSIVRRLPTILLETEVSATPRSLALFVGGGRFVAFVLVYGLLLGLAYLAGTRRDDPSADVELSLATGAVAALSYLVGTGLVLLVAGVGQQDRLFAALVTAGSGVGVGANLAVVTFAGLALARR